MRNTNHSKLLQVVAGEAGDNYLGIATHNTKKYSLIKIGPDGATITECTIRGVDVMAARGYGALPAGYQMIAGGEDYFDKVVITAGSAEGVLYPEEVIPGTFAVAVTGGVKSTTMTPTITYTNAGGSGSKKVMWRTRNAEDAIVQAGESIIYFLKGVAAAVGITGLSFHSVAAEGYEFDMKLEDSEVWTTSAPFEIAES